MKQHQGRINTNKTLPEMKLRHTFERSREQNIQEIIYGSFYSFRNLVTEFLPHQLFEEEDGWNFDKKYFMVEAAICRIE